MAGDRKVSGLDSHRLQRRKLPNTFDDLSQARGRNRSVGHILPP